jgi:predicted nuclease of predicted toxin-antitoxin system
MRLSNWLREVPGRYAVVARIGALASRQETRCAACEAALDRASDEAIIARAADEARTVITADLDYPRLLALGHAVGPSLILFRGGNWSDADVVAKLAELLASLSEADIEHSITVVQRDRVRRRRLPIA